MEPLVKLRRKDKPIPLSELKLACRPGCAHCCRSVHLNIVIGRAEAKRIISYMEEHELIDDRFVARLEAYRDLEASLPGLDDIDVDDPQMAHHLYELAKDDKRMNMPCPLLNTSTNRCSVYKVRPMVCMTYDSISEQDCIDRMHGKAVELEGTPIDAYKLGYGKRDVIETIKFVMDAMRADCAGLTEAKDRYERVRPGKIATTLLAFLNTRKSDHELQST